MSGSQIYVSTTVKSSVWIHQKANIVSKCNISIYQYVLHITTCIANQSKSNICLKNMSDLVWGRNYFQIFVNKNKGLNHHTSY